jgi:hypothetical protein
LGLTEPETKKSNAKEVNNDDGPVYNVQSHEMENLIRYAIIREKWCNAKVKVVGR